MKIKLNDDSSLVRNVLSKLEENKLKYGEKYCPCKLEHTTDNICMCKEFLKTDIPGECHCGLYIKVNEEK